LNDQGLPWKALPTGLSLTIRLTPKSARDAIEGLERLADGRCVLKARVRAPASEGEANAALVKLVARALAVPPRDVVLAAGATARIKRLTITGDAPTLAAVLEKLTRVS
jgi:hypothetical protein